MTWGAVTGCALLGFGLVVMLVPIILFCTRRWQLGRRRDFHHAHAAPVPRLGGLALAVTFLVMELLLNSFVPDQRSSIPGRNAVVLSSAAMFLLGFCDDLVGLGAKRKLLGQVLIAAGVYASGLGIETVKVPFTEEVIELQAWGGWLTIAWLVGITNLMNLIDGVDGLAGGIGVMLMGLLVYVGLQNGTFVLITATMTGALLGFLCFNFPPARIYLGDGGAYLLGFQIGIFSLVGSHKGTVMAALVAPLFVLALPILDTSLAILRRGLRGLPVFRPDRSHIHHRLLGTGMSRKQVVLALYALTLIFLMLGFAAFWSRGQLVPVLLGLSLLIILVCAGRLSFSREWFAVGRTVGNSLAMRQQIQYAVSLTGWLKQEAKRCRSMDELYHDVVFAARRLGFTGVKVTCVGIERTWRQEAVCHRQKAFHLELPGARPGFLEFHAPTCGRPELCASNAKAEQTTYAAEAAWDAASPKRRDSACPGDLRMFEVMADLLAEAFQPALLRSEQELAPFGQRAEQAESNTSYQSKARKSPLTLRKDSAPA